MMKIIKYLLLILSLVFVVNKYVFQPPLDLETLKERYTDEHSNWMEMNGLDVHYKDEGSGVSIVLIHGTGASLQTFDEWADTLKKYYRVIRMDLPAFGLTGPNIDNDYSIKSYVAFIDEFTRKLGLEDFVLGGNSLGGEIAWKYAYYHPAQVAGLILLSPAGSPIQEYDMPFFSAFTLARIPVISQLFSKVNSKYLVEKTLRQAYEKEELLTEDKIRMYQDMSLREGNRAAFVYRMQQIQHDPILQPNELMIPTLIIWGEKDKILPLKQFDGFVEMKNMQSVIYEDVGHTPHDEVAVRSVHEAIEFINKLEKYSN